MGKTFSKGAIGVASDEVSMQIGDFTTIIEKKTGVGSTWGLGYDIRLGRNPYLTPNFDVLLRTIEQNGVTSTNIIMLITLGLTWH